MDVGPILIGGAGLLGAVAALVFAVFRIGKMADTALASERTASNDRANALTLTNENDKLVKLLEVKAGEVKRERAAHENTRTQFRKVLESVARGERPDLKHWLQALRDLSAPDNQGSGGGSGEVR